LCLLLQLHAVHNTRWNYEEPDKFRPERWLEPRAEYARPGSIAASIGARVLLMEGSQVRVLVV
jgi:cytochrome P450